MRASCRVERPGKPDPLTGLPSWTQVYDGRCYTRYPGLAFEQSPEAGGAVFTVSRLVVRVPFGVAYRPGDRVTIVSDPDNPQMAGTRLRVASIDDQSQASAQRLLCEDYQ